MFAITEVTNPRLERGRIVFLDDGAVGDEARATRDRGPFAAGVEEGEVDVWVGFEVVGLAGFGIGMEKEVDAVAFLSWSKIG